MVNARVFSEKLRILLAALASADKTRNGRVSFDYFVADLKKSSVDATIMSATKPRLRKQPNETSIGAFSRCLAAVSVGRADTARQYGDCFSRIGKLGAGAGKSFQYGEIYSSIEASPFRLDEFLAEQSRSIDAVLNDPNTQEGTKHFKGVSYSSFDGVLKAVDLRGSMPEGKLILTSGGRQIDCIFNGLADAEIKRFLDKEMRVRVRGSAFYDGRSGLPRRIIISKLPSIVPAKGNLRIWKGTFSPFKVSEVDEMETQAV